MLGRKEHRRFKIKMRIRKRIFGTNICPRLSVFRSNRDIYAQLIDDAASHTLVSASSKEKSIVSKEINKTEKAKLVGMNLAKIAKEVGISEVVFDRGGFLYHGRVKALAEGAREGGLKF